jgi:hypothetical protein
MPAELMRESAAGRLADYPQELTVNGSVDMMETDGSQIGRVR